MSDLTSVLGYQCCRICGDLVLDVVAFKTDHHCAECFRKHAAEILAASLVVVAGREKIVLRTHVSKRKPGDRAQRARAKQRDRQRPEVKDRRRIVAGCNDRASRRMRRLLPELYEILLADERAKAGLDHWTIDQALTPGTAQSSLDSLQAYYHLEQEAS